ncbi:MAG TPA: phosphohistidine phosphatase SixA [Gemmatimonadaceae bacterium]|nr:phosphohistidine phosphatase SixA [Gemmatimonadaceae bacterium]
MELLVVRHAIAEEREDFARTGRDDSERPLTSEGRRKMKSAAEGLRKIVHSIDVLASSPFTRAWQTAEIVSREFSELAIERVDALEPEGAPDDFLAWLGTHEGGDEKRIAVVGHEPHLSGLVTWLMTGDTGHIIEFKKGGACLLSLHGKAKEGVATLVWAMQPGQLRAISRA